ncbi:histidine phosphatase family protein, partial [Streptomyces pathocidini]|uniref:histidine phosphatase family protein n=1 Tax=Streptomyces pathocidini TaxID=1650571 RepID=UPI0033D3EA5F
MTIRLTLICAVGAEGAGREPRFGDGPADERGLRQARELREGLPPAARCYAAPGERCRRTAEAMGLAAEVHPGLRDGDMGAWDGRTLTEVTAADPDGVAEPPSAGRSARWAPF